MRIGTKIGASFALALAILSTIGLISYRNTTQLVDTARIEKHTYQVLDEVEDLNSSIKDAETGQRGYILTGDKRYLQPYNSAVAVIEKRLNNLRTLTADNVSQQARINTLEPLVARRLELIEQTIALRAAQGFEPALQIVLTDEGKVLMEQIRSIVTNIESEERQLLQQRSLLTQAATRQTIYTILYGLPLAFLTLIVIDFFLTRNISQPLAQVSSIARKLTAGNLDVSLPESDRQDEIGILTQTFNQMIASLRETTTKNSEQAWLKSNLAKFAVLLQGQRNIETLAEAILSELIALVGAQQGAFYLMDFTAEAPILKLLSSYAPVNHLDLPQQFDLGEGLVGQCAVSKQKILLTEVPHNYLRIGSGLGEATAQTILVLPVLFETKITAVIELASLQQFSELHLSFLAQASNSVGVVLNTIASDTRTKKLLKQSQALATELQTQQEELRTSNQRLEQQQAELQHTNEELQQLNEELEENAELLALRNQQVEQKNQAIEQARQSVEEKAAELERTSYYKSQFLANMSHELRTPLNSLLILAKLLSDNVQGNLTEKQVEYSRTIYGAGSELLGLINDILDLAKIESGTMSVDINPLQLTELCDNIERSFRQVALDKALDFAVEVTNRVPETIYTDSKRLQQILKNLLANAFKFTDQGTVRFQIDVATQGWNADQEALNRAAMVLAFAVQDTGIGISQDKHELIFIAFQQADGTTSRKYGGTGLGLSISREIARLLGGEIQLASDIGEGSTFTLFLPVNDIGSRTLGIEFSAGKAVPLISDDRNEIEAGDRILLVMQDDMNFAALLLDMARQNGFKVLLARNANDGLLLAQQFQPTAILLDVQLPDLDSTQVLESLQRYPTTRNIPVHTISNTENIASGLPPGAIAYVQKPVSSEFLTQLLTDIKESAAPQKNLLIVEDNETQRQSIVDLIQTSDVTITAVGTGAETLAALAAQHFDGVILDLGLPDMTGFELIEQIKARSDVPIIIYTGKELTRSEETQLRRIAQTIVIKDSSDRALGVSLERLLDETALFLHRVQAALPSLQPQPQPEALLPSDRILTGKKILIVDDDVRNIFALTSMLERYQIEVVFAENGSDGISVLKNTPDIDLVLMDVMMPEMDGYETMQAIREHEQFKALPIIAVTAKAMSGDREKCIAAGASDYITKPVDTEQLLSLMRVWLYQ